jgi:hypothetical protein
MPRITLPTYASFLVASGPTRITKVLQARRAQEGPASYPAGDHYIHLRAPLRDALLAGGDPRPLLDVLDDLHDARKALNYQAIVDGLIKVFRTTDFEGRSIDKRSWIHRDLTVTVNPTARLYIGGRWHVVYVHLNQEPLDARSIQPVLELIRITHGDLGEPLIIDARRAKLHRPSPSARTRRGLAALLDAEAESFLSLWHGVAGVA